MGFFDHMIKTGFLEVDVALPRGPVSGEGNNAAALEVRFVLLNKTFG